MIEAVGYEYWPTYFSTIDRVLAPGGRVGIQAIRCRTTGCSPPAARYTWINKYIFPGGFLPSVEVIDEITRRDTTLRVTDRLAFGSRLRRDAAAVGRGVPRPRPTRCARSGFDETFLRMWHFYLGYSRAGFASGYLDVQQLVLARPEVR